MLISKGELLNIELEQSAIHGTHRNCDIIPELVAMLCQTPELMKMEKDEDSLYNIAMDAKEEGECSKFWDTEDATEFCNELFEIADSYAPEGYYFGAHPGDSSDFGYWKCDP